MQNLIPIILVAVALATALNVILRRFKMPTMVGYIVTGAIMGSLVQFDVRGNETLDQVAGFGIVFLMFTIGLGVSFSDLRKMKKEVLLFGLSQVVVTSVVLAAIAVIYTSFRDTLPTNYCNLSLRIS